MFPPNFMLVSPSEQLKLLAATLLFLPLFSSLCQNFYISATELTAGIWFLNTTWEFSTSHKISLKLKKCNLVRVLGLFATGRNDFHRQ